MYTRQQYMNKQISFEEYYGELAKECHISFAKSDMLPRIREALKTNKNLNSIPLRVWDMMAYSYLDKNYLHQVFKNHGDCWSLAGHVCMLKVAAIKAAKKNMK